MKPDPKPHNPPKPPRCTKCGLFQGFAGMHTRTCTCPEFLQSVKEDRSSPKKPNEAQEKLLTIDNAAELFLKAASKVTTFDNKQDKKDWLLDIISEFKRLSKGDPERKCECGANKRTVLDCTVKPCKYPTNKEMRELMDSLYPFTKHELFKTKRQQ